MYFTAVCLSDGPLSRRHCPPITKPPLPQSSNTSERHRSEAAKSSYCSSIACASLGNIQVSNNKKNKKRFRPFESSATVSINGIVIASRQAFHSNLINLDLLLLLLLLSCLQLLFAFSTIYECLISLICTRR